MDAVTQFKIFLLVYRFSHHSSASGYNRLAEYLPCTPITIPRPIGNILIRAAGARMRKRLLDTTGLPGYFPECRWLEWATGLMSKIPRNSIFHFIYPENSYYFSGNYRKSKHAKIIATYHQPLKESHQFILKADAIRKLDGIILMSNSQREFFEPLVGSERVFVVPYGVDLNYFKPSKIENKGERFIAVGSWLRDHETLSGALKILELRRPTASCDIVTADYNRHHFSERKNVRFHSGIPDSELLNLYHLSQFSVLPLSGAAANTALLESLACGLPLIATDLPAVREYTRTDGARYVRPSDPEHLAETIIDLLDDPNSILKMGLANQEHSSNYSWERVAERTLNAYQAIVTH